MAEGKERSASDSEGFIERDSFAQHLGIEAVAAPDGRVRVRMEIGQRHLNGLGSLHGGAIFSLADVALALASNSPGTRAVASNVGICFFKAVTDGVVIAEAREVVVTSKLATYLVEVRREQGGDLVAQMQGTVYRKSAAHR